MQALYDAVFTVARLRGSPGFVQVVEALRDAAFVRVVPLPAGGEGADAGLVFVKPWQLCFHLTAPNAAYYPVPTLSSEVRGSRQVTA